MTLTALIEGIRTLPRARVRVTVHVQSEHVVNALSNNWLALWRERGWVKHDGTPVKNRDLWELLAPETERHDVRWRPFDSSEGSQQERVSAIAAAQR